MGCQNTQVWNWQCWVDPTDQGNAAAGLCFFHFIQCLLEWSWILHPSPISGKMFPLSPIYGNSAPVSPGTWRGGSVSPGGVSVALTSPEWAEAVPSPALGCLREPGKTPERGKSPLLVLHGESFAFQECVQLGSTQPHSQDSWKAAQVTLCWNLMSFRGVEILYEKSVSLIRLLFFIEVTNTSTYFSKISFLLMTEMKCVVPLCTSMAFSWVTEKQISQFNCSYWEQKCIFCSSCGRYTDPVGWDFWLF